MPQPQQALKAIENGDLNDFKTHVPESALRRADTGSRNEYLKVAVEYRQPEIITYIFETSKKNPEGHPVTIDEQTWKAALSTLSAPTVRPFLQHDPSLLEKELISEDGKPQGRPLYYVFERMSDMKFSRHFKCHHPLTCANKLHTTYWTSNNFKELPIELPVFLLESGADPCPSPPVVSGTKNEIGESIGMINNIDFVERSLRIEEVNGLLRKYMDDWERRHHGSAEKSDV